MLVIENQDGPKAKYMVAAWTSEGENLLVGLNNGEVKKFSLSGEKKGEAVKSIKAHDEAVSDLQTSLDRSYFITSSRDKLAKLFDSESREHPQLRGPGATQLCVHHNCQGFCYCWWWSRRVCCHYNC